MERNRRQTDDLRPELISTAKAANELGKKILDASVFTDTVVLGVDLEGLTKGRPLALLQVSRLIQLYFENKAYLIDALVVPLHESTIKDVSFP